ncbi:hypothetical protein [Roseiconus lacunae]|uniref:Uncharacterized protein n=1 Tax=Roseiconus lacunae TaxID=2605694 RepID=A0ABT7PF27_9BACT|nr:hypothetical protein [Roseiconus lacunae]MDM4015100.1 hypothetical protein [Roseiconus lacunae]
MASKATGRHAREPEKNLGRVLLQPPDLRNGACSTRVPERIGGRFGGQVQCNQTIDCVNIQRIAEILAPHRECEHQFDITDSLHRSEAAIAMIAVVLVTIIMLIAAVVLSVFATRIGIIVVMRNVFVVVQTVLVSLLNRSRQSVRIAA